MQCILCLSRRCNEPCPACDAIESGEVLQPHPTYSAGEVELVSVHVLCCTSDEAQEGLLHRRFSFRQSRLQLIKLNTPGQVSQLHLKRLTQEQEFILR